MSAYSFYIVFLLGLLADFGVESTTRAPKEVNVGVLLPAFEVDGKLFDQPVRAVRMAFDEINKNPNILPDTQVRVVVNSTGYDRWQAIEAALWQVNVANAISIVGGADASAVRVISPIVKEGDVPLISPSAVEYEPNSEILYPTFYRVGPPADRLSLAVKEIIDQFSWRKIAVIHSDDDYGINGIRYAIDIAIAQGHQITSVYMEEPHSPHLTDSEIQDIHRLKDDDLRIFVVVLHPGEQAAVLRVASGAGMFKEGYAWIIAHCNYGTDLFVQGKMDGIICIRQQINDTVSKELFERMQKSEYRGEESSMWTDSVYAYNAANSIAQALNAVLQSESKEEEPVNDKRSGSCPDYRPTGTAVGKELLNVLRTESFTDITGSFNLNGTSWEVEYEYLNYHNGQFVLFARYNQEFSPVNTDSNTQLVHFPGNKTIIPLDIPAKHSSMLMVLVPISYPITHYIDKTTQKRCVHPQDHSNCEATGIAITLINNITAKIGLVVNFTPWTDNWNELVREIGKENSKWDIAAGAATITSVRSQQVTFSSSIYDSGLKILIKRPPIEGWGYFGFIKPFTWPVWLLIIITILIGTVAFMLIVEPEAVERNKDLNADVNDCNQKREGLWFRILDAVYFSWCTAFVVHSVDGVNRLCSRFYLAVLSFVMFVLLGVFTANMTAFLASQHSTQSIHDFKDLLNVTVGCRPGTSDWDYVENELSVKDITVVKNGLDAVQLLKNEVIQAYVADTPHLLGLAATDCDVVVTGHQEQHQKYAFPMKRSLPYSNQINKAILEAVEKEYITVAFNKVFANATKCPSMLEQDTTPKLTLKDFAGLLTLAAGAAFVISAGKGTCLLCKKMKSYCGGRQGSEREKILTGRPPANGEDTAPTNQD